MSGPSPVTAKAVQLDESRVKILKVQQSRPPEQEKRRYYIGLRKDSPLHFVTVGCHAFHKIVDPPVQELNGDVHRQRRAGQVVQMTAAQLKLCLDSVIYMGVRKTATEAYVVSWTTDKKGNERLNPNDEPLARHIFIVELPGDAHPDPAWTDTASDVSPEPLAS